MQNNIFRIGSFNLYNLVLPEKKYYGHRQYSYPDYEKKTSWIASQLDHMRADLVGFQEIFHEEALKQAIAKSEYLKDAYVISANPNGRSPVVGFASKYKIIKYEVIEDFPEVLDIEDTIIPIQKFSRPILKVLVEVKEGLKVYFYVAHLKSKRPLFKKDEDRENPNDVAKGEARSLIKRTAEAAAFRVLLMDTLKNRDVPVVVMGDLNDSSLSVSTRIVSGQPPFRKFPRTVKEKIWDVLLYHARDIQARQSFHDVYYSHIHNGHYEALDHIMVSQELVKENPNNIGRVGYVSVFNDHLIDETLSDAEINCWKSDHAQVVASIELKQNI